MRKLITLLFAWAVCCMAWADELTENLKFGHPTMAEMELETYEPEPDAAALVLCALRDEHYIYVDGEFRRMIEHKVRIKVLKPEGTDYANVSCVYRSSKKDNTRYKESVSGISATAYNLEGPATGSGQARIVSTKMKNDLVFRERIDDDLMLLKFSVPQVKVGTVMEYAFTEYSDNDVHIDDWFAQGELPVIYTRFTLAVPECYVFAVENTGSIVLETKTGSGTMSISEAGASAAINTATYSFIGRNVPSLKDDDSVWCIDDYRAKVTLEFQRTVPPFPYKNYTTTWEEIGKLLMDDEDFGKRISSTTPLKAEVAALQLDTIATVDEKVAAICSLLMSKAEWNKGYTLYPTKRAAAVLKDGLGSSADLNFMLIAMLRSVGIEAWPLIVRMRHNGHLPVTHPSLSKLNTFVVAFSRGSSEGWGLVDACSKAGYIDVLRPQLMSDQGLLVLKNGIEWIDLSERCSGREVTRIEAEVAPDGNVVGTRTNHYFQQLSLALKESLKDREDSDVQESIGRDLEASISGYKVNSDIEAFSPSIIEEFAFEKKAQVAGDIIYVNPFVFPLWSENPYAKEKREVPIERAMKTTMDYAVTLTIPEGYEVEELPKSLNLKSPDNSLSCKVIFAQDEHTIKVNYRYQLRRLLFLPQEYADLRQIYDLIFSKCNEMIAIKKI